jgi:hypothetical protein
MNLKRTSWWVVLAVFVATGLVVWLVGRWLLAQFIALHGGQG